MLPRILYYIVRPIFLLVCFLCNGILALLHWRKRKYVPPIKDHLLLKSATTLAKEIREMQIKSEDVVQAYIKRILDIEPYINATVEGFFEDALEKARNVDNLVASGNYSKEQLAEDKPFLGVPLSVKVLLKVKGLRCTGGSLFFKDVVATEDSPTVALMKKAGAIVIATTNIPEFGMSLESNNKLHGKTCNPYDTRRTSGGSSGGESALISAAGSVIGLGNDLAGSIRIPCHFTGLFGHKPSAGVVSNGGCYPDVSFLKELLYTGPMCRYAEDLISSMKILTSECARPLNIGKPVDFSKLKIFYMVEIQGLFVNKLDKEIENGLTAAVSYFQRKYGNKVEQMQIDLMHRVSEGFIHYLNAKLNGRALKTLMTQGKAANVDERLDFIKCFVGKSEFSFSSLMILNILNCPLLFSKNSIILYYQELLEELYIKLDMMLDDNTVLLLPTFPKIAPYHHGSFPLMLSSGYTSIFNLLGLPSTQCPIGFNNQGMPYGIQIIGKKNNDALTIACAVELEKAFGGWVPPRNK